MGYVKIAKICNFWTFWPVIYRQECPEVADFCYFSLTHIASTRKAVLDPTGVPVTGGPPINLK